MKKLFYSEELKKYFEDEAECLRAEKEFEEKHKAEIAAKEKRAADAKEVTEAYKKYIQLRTEFIKKYGSYHVTLTDKDLPEKPLFSLLDDWWLL